MDTQQAGGLARRVLMVDFALDFMGALCDANGKPADYNSGLQFWTPIDYGTEDYNPVDQHGHPTSWRVGSARIDG
jgi:hypothetical protein